MTALSAMAQQQRLVQHLDLSSPMLLIFATGNANEINIVQDTVDYVGVSSAMPLDTASLPQIFLLQELEHIPGGMSLVVNAPAIVDQVEIHLRNTAIGIIGNGRSDIRVTSANPDDTLVFKSLTINAMHYCYIGIVSPVKTKSITLYAMGHGSVYCTAYWADNYFESCDPTAILHISSRNGEKVEIEGHRQITQSFSHIPKNPTRYPAKDRLHLSLAGALLQNIAKPANNLLYISETFQTQTTPSNWQVQLGYDVACRPHFAFTMGIGYDFARYHCRHPYLNFGAAELGAAILATTTPDFGTGDSLKYWHTDLTAHYLTLPFSFTYYSQIQHRKGFHAGLDIIAGIPIGDALLHQRYSNYDDMTSNDLHTPNVVNTFSRMGTELQCDLRARVGWGSWSVMAQFSTTGLLQYIWVGQIHPLRIGLELNL